MNYGDLAFAIVEILFAAGLYLFAGFAAKVQSSKWKLCYVVPFLVALFVVTILGFEISMLGIYAGALLLLTGFVREEKKTRKMVSLLAGMAMVFSVVVCHVDAGYRAPDYTSDFKRGFEEMKAHYVLTEHKKIDWDGLYEKYLPEFEEADRNHDEVAACLAWYYFAMEFHDGHVMINPYSERVRKEVLERACGNDYGLSLMTLSDGRTVSVNVEKDSIAGRAGIHNGTEILAWDGKTIGAAVEEMKENDVMIQNSACAENEVFYQTVSVAGMGGESVEVTFLDDNGKEQTVTLDKIGFYASRWEETIEILNKGVEISNLEWKNIDDKTALLRMRFMNYDAAENFDLMEEEVRNRLLELKEAGVTNLIFDLRSNAGGSASHVERIAKLIAPEGEHTYIYDGVLNTETMKYEKGDLPDTYQVGECETYQGENLWGHGKIIILVNAHTISGGDHFTWLGSTYPNVTVMGFTHSNCSGQGVNEVRFDYGSLSYSCVLLVQKDGTIFLDTDENRQATVPLDVQIPFDEKAVKAIFDDGEDYVLDYAVNYFGN